MEAKNKCAVDHPSSLIRTVKFSLFFSISDLGISRKIFQDSSLPKTGAKERYCLIFPTNKAGAAADRRFLSNTFRKARRCCNPANSALPYSNGHAALPNVSPHSVVVARCARLELGCNSFSRRLSVSIICSCKEALRKRRRCTAAATRGVRRCVWRLHSGLGLRLVRLHAVDAR